MEKSKYTGYVWYSDQTKPRVLTGDEAFEPDLSAGCNPFIVEAQLYDEPNGKSYSIRYWDGACHVASHNVPQNVRERHAADIVAYASSRMNGRRLLFWQRWDKRDDELCMGMPTLVLSALVFIGFEK